MTDEEIQQAVHDLYDAVLGRAPDPGGAADAAVTLRIEGDAGVLRMLRRLLASEEYRRRRAREASAISTIGSAGATLPYRLAPDAEPVRLVIWDLDETLWKGTLTEGGVHHVTANEEIVKALAARGIISSICSKNDADQVDHILKDRGIRDYFVFASVDWTAKGPRVRQIVDNVQLRPETVLFIDDNPHNLEEVRLSVPGIQVASHEIIPQLLDSPLFDGKDDKALSRLDQYRLLERRSADRLGVTGDDGAFLRSSGIRVEIIHDVGRHLPRAVELINRTNQLNFTKVRLPEDAEAAQAMLGTLVTDAQVQAGLIRVSDNYGDYGICGIYVLAARRLLHFAFSCRILGMGVETWLYRRLGSPHVDVRGDVLTDLRSETAIDWIELQKDSVARDPVQDLYPTIFARGGCDLHAICHYLQFVTPHLDGEYNITRAGLDVRRDHSIFLHYAMNGISAEQLSVAERLGYREEDFVTAMSDGREDGACLLSFLADTAYALYRHRETGILLPFSSPVASNHRLDARADASALSEHERHANPSTVDAFALLNAEFDFIGPIEPDQTVATILRAIERLAHSAKIFIVAGNDRQVTNDGSIHRLEPMTVINKRIAEMAEAYSNVTIIPLRQFILSEDEVHSWNHFDRLVYFRAAEFIKQSSPRST